MTFFKFLWLRKLIRKNTRPIPFKKANRWRNRLSIAYAICAWNLFGLIAWEYYKGRGTKEAYGGKTDEYDMLSPAQRFALTSGIEKAKIIRSNKLESVDFRLEDFQHMVETTNKENADEVDKHDTDNVA